MSIFNDNVVLNLVVDGLILVLNLIIFIGLLFDKFLKIRKSYSNFLYVVVFYELFVVLDVITILVFNTGIANIDVVKRIVLAVYKFYNLILLLPYSIWFIDIISERHKYNVGMKEMAIIFISVTAVAFFFITLFNGKNDIIYTGSMAHPLNLIYNITYIIVAFACVSYVFANFKYLNTWEKVLFPCSMVLPHLVSYNTIWSYRPTIIVIFIILVLMYQTLWTSKNNEIALKEKEITDAKVEVMVSQIQPHFLYNSLNSIASLCTLDPSKAQDITIKFSNYLRANLDAIKTNKLVSFDEELKHVQNYLDIEKVRFGSKLKIEYDIRFSNFVLPPLTVQPIVENAVKHGICKKTNGGTIYVTSIEESDYYKIIVSDDGVGFDLDKVDFNDGTHVGISNVKNRLKLQCNGELRINSVVGNGTTVVIGIPKEGF